MKAIDIYETCSEHPFEDVIDAEYLGVSFVSLRADAISQKSRQARIVFLQTECLYIAAVTPIHVQRQRSREKKVTTNRARSITSWSILKNWYFKNIKA